MKIFDDPQFESQEQTATVAPTIDVFKASVGIGFGGSWLPTGYERSKLDALNNQGPVNLNEIAFGKSLYEADKTILLPDEVEQKSKAIGVKLDRQAKGITQDAFDFLVERRQEEAKRNFVLNNAEDSVLNSAAKFVGEFTGMMGDPSNIALAFVPVVNGAKYSTMLAKAGGVFGRTGIRMGVGAAEGFVGSAIVEPFILNNRQALQDDYDIYDSMFNVAAGTFFGSALHSGAGLFGDTASRAIGYKPEWRKIQELNAIKSGEVKPATLSDLDIKTAKQQLEIMDALSEVSLPRTGMEAANVIDARIAGLREASARGLDKDVVIQLKAEQDELAMLLTDVNRIERERIAGNVVKQRDGVLDTLSPEELKLATDRLAEIKVTLEQHKLGMDSAKSLKELNEKLGKIDLDSDLIELSERINPSNRKYYELKESKELTPENRKALDTDIYANIRPIMAQLAPETQARMFRAVIAQVAEGRPPDAMAAMLSDPKLIDMPGVREQVVKLAKENLAEPANITNRMAREADEAYARSLSTGDASKDAELLLYEQSTFADYMARSGLDKSEAEMKAITRAIEADELEFSKAKSQADAAKQAAACLMGAL